MAHPHTTTQVDPCRKNFIIVSPMQYAAIVSAADEEGVELCGFPFDLGDGYGVLDEDLGALEDLRPGFIDTLRFLHPVR